LWAKAGYGFNSKRWRYAFGLEQALWRERPLAIGGELDRSLVSYDDWLLSDHENMLFALLVTEDFKDYYEAEGGTIYLRFEPFNFSRLDVAYRYEETKWLPSNPELWSLFGGDKFFRENFSTVNSEFRQSGKEEIDTTVNAFMKATLTYDTRDKDAVFDHSSWLLNGELEWSHPDIHSDFDYTRYNVLAKRYQSLQRRVMLMITGIWGKSDGYLPMHRRFYLGGLGTLRGYYHKEFMGSAFWMASTEYRIGFRGTDIATSVLWDVGQITENFNLTEDTEIRHNIGLAVYLDDDFKLIVSKRMDSSDRNDVKFYVRLTNVF
jgi:outer membrane protein assembly factor BamA